MKKVTTISLIESTDRNSGAVINHLRGCSSVFNHLISEARGLLSKTIGQ